MGLLGLGVTKSQWRGARGWHEFEQSTSLTDVFMVRGWTNPVSGRHVRQQPQASHSLSQARLEAPAGQARSGRWARQLASERRGWVLGGEERAQA